MKQTSIKKTTMFLFTALLLVACSGKGGNPSGDTNPSDDDNTSYNGTNNPPIASAGVDQTVNKYTTVHLNASASHDDSPTLTYKWSIASAPKNNTAKLSSTTSITPSITPNTFGTYIFDLTVSDGTYNATDSVSITVRDTKVLSVFKVQSGWEPWVTNGTTSGTKLLKDIDAPLTKHSYPESLLQMGNTLYFTAKTHEHGRELWKSDGTQEGTLMVKDINEGRSPSRPQSFIDVNGTLFFNARDDVHGFALWKSDGTQEGTVMVKDVYDSVTNGKRTKNSKATSFRNVNGSLFFLAGTSGKKANELWKSDGTKDGTVIVKRFDELDNAIVNLTVFNDLLYFRVHQDNNAHELWKSDGTEAGTIKVKGVSADNLTNMNGMLYFSSYNSSTSDKLTNVNGTLYYSSYNSSTSSSELWKSDGTEAGTVMVKDNTNNPGFTPYDYFTNVNGILYFQAYDDEHGYELWKSDGTEAGTVMVKNISTSNDGSSPEYLTNVNGTVYFSASTSEYGKEVWKSDGTKAGTVMVKDINEGKNQYGPIHLTNINGTLYFLVDDGKNGSELWKSDGTKAGTVMVKDIYKGELSSSASDVTEINGILYFSAKDNIHGAELWKSDGSEEGTVMLKDINTAGEDSSHYLYTNFLEIAGNTYFAVNDAVHGEELWKSDGTSEGTIMVKDIVPGQKGGSYSGLNNLNNTLYFNLYLFTVGHALWKSDGTESGTQKVDDNNTINQFKSEGYIKVGNSRFFTKHDTNNDKYNLWKTEGSLNDAIMVKEINSSSKISKFVQANGILFFKCKIDDNYAMWRSDGTKKGTYEVKKDKTSSSNLNISTTLNGTLYFYVKDTENGFYLWKSDGTIVGTVKVKNVNDIIDAMRTANNSIYFTTGRGQALWKSDGTQEGTDKMIDFSNDKKGISYISSVGDKLLYLVYHYEVGTSSLHLYDGKTTVELVEP